MPEAAKTTPDPTAQLAADEKIAEQLERMIGKEGGATGAVKILYDDNLDVRTKNRELRTLVNEIRAKMPEGSVILTGADAEAWEKIRALKLDPAKLTERLTKADELEASLAKRDQADVDREAADLLKWKPKVLGQLRSSLGFTLAIADEESEEEGKKTTRRVPVVVPKEGDPIPLADYPDLQEYHPALVLDAGTEKPVKEEPQKPVLRMLKQKSGEQGITGQPDLDKLADRARATGAYPRF